MEKCYLLHVSLGGKPNKARITEAALEIKTLLSEVSPDHQLAYTSGDGGTFGFLFKSSLSAGQIVGRISSPGKFESVPTKSVPPSPLRNDDSLLVLEIGADAANLGKTRVQAWLQHHRPSTSLEVKSPAASGGPKEPSQLASQLAEIKDKLQK